MPIAADDSTIAAALESADIPTLLAVLVQLTGDTRRLESDHGWPEYFSRRGELQAYFERCATKYGVRPRIRFRTEVVSARWHEAKARWEVLLRTEDGSEERIEDRTRTAGTAAASSSTPIREPDPSDFVFTRSRLE